MDEEKTEHASFDEATVATEMSDEEVKAGVAFMVPKGTIGYAVECMRAGFKMCRAGWNGKGMWLALKHLDEITGDPGQMTAPFVYMKTADDKFVPWLCSQTDLLATDWEIAE